MNNMENGKEPGRRLSQLSGYNSRRSCVGEVHKPYEKMLLEEIPGKTCILLNPCIHTKKSSFDVE